MTSSYFLILTRKAANVLASFVKPNQVLGADQIIPPDVLRRAKGLAIITVLKAGFLFSGRAGSGVIVARLHDGSWSAPAAIGMAGAGAGGLVGVELTDFVFILNTQEAVNSFTEFGTLTLGGNVSVAAGPVGRNAEADASASMGGFAAVFAYSKSKGLFAGISVEGSVILERREANRKLYGDNCTSQLILSGKVDPPSMAHNLYKVLDSKAFNGGVNSSDFEDSDFYDDIPSNFNSSDEASSEFYNRHVRNGRDDGYDDDEYNNGSRGAGNVPLSRSKWGHRSHNNMETEGGYARRGNPRSHHHYDYDSNEDEDDYIGYDNRRRTSRKHTNVEKPVEENTSPFNEFANANKNGKGENTDPTSGHASNEAVALYRFTGEQKGDLSFQKGDKITILKRTESQNDWWSGRVNGKEGIFPANYVELI